MNVVQMTFTRGGCGAAGSFFLLLVACGGHTTHAGNGGVSGAGGSPNHADGGRDSASGTASAIGGSAGQPVGDAGALAGGQAGFAQAGSLGKGGEFAAAGTASGGAGNGGKAGSTSGRTGNGGVGGSPSGGTGNGGTGGRASGGASSGGSGGAVITTAYKQACTNYCTTLTSEPIFCPKFDESSTCASDCQVGLSAYNGECASLGLAMTACITGYSHTTQICIVNTWIGVDGCLAKIEAYQDCQREHGATPLPSPIPCPGKPEPTADGCTLIKSCENTAPYFVSCVPDETGMRSKCTVVVNGKTTLVNSPEPANGGAACEDPLVSVFAQLLPK